MTEPLSFKDLENLVSELRASNDELKESYIQKENVYISKENLYHQIVNSCDDGVIVIQGDTFKYINQTSANLLDINTDDFEELKFSDIIHEDYKGELIKSISQIVSGDQITTNIDTQLVNISGVAIQVSIVLKKLTLSNNQVSVLVHITDVKETGTNSKQGNSLRKVVDLIDKHSEEGIFLLTKPEGDNQALFAWNIEDVNSAGCKLLEKEQSVVVDKMLGDFLTKSEDISIPVEDEVSDFDDDIELHIKNLNKYLRFSIYPISKTKIICKVVDVTDFYLTKMQLNKNLQRDELFTEILNIFNSDKSYSEKYSSVIERIAYNFGTKRIVVFYDEVNKNNSLINHQHSAKGFSLLNDKTSVDFNKVPSWNKMLLERKMILGFSTKFLPDDIVSFFKDLNIDKAYVFPIFIEEELFGSVLYENYSENSWDNTEINYLKMVSGLISNLTSRQMYEVKLLKAKQSAEEADKLKSSFLANMSHDIRIPMTSILGFSDLLADPDLTVGEREEFIELVNDSGQDLLTLVDNIVDVAKIETGQLRVNIDKVSIVNLFNDLNNTYSKNSKIYNHDDLDLILDIPEKYDSISFDTDGFRFKQVMGNLLDNAIKFTDTGNIRFGISNIWAETIEFYVQDSGIGIPEDIQQTIFKSFSKADRNYTKEYNGTGLGLAISKSLVELLSGEIRVVSYPGKGSTFYFTHPLPKEVDEKVEIKVDKNKGVSYNWEDKTILIAEDVEQNYRYLEYILAQTKVKIIWAKNGKEALNYFKDKKECDCILMDIRMPEMNGIEASKEILKLRDIPIIVQTAYTLGDEKELSINAGCVDYISKPVNAGKLLKIVEKYL